tara:strand:+ start:894 stop:1022 length:129 start_codon:yes stop_codon:yes gene_type:complete
MNNFFGIKIPRKYVSLERNYTLLQRKEVVLLARKCKRFVENQ